MINKLDDILCLDEEWKDVWENLKYNNSGIILFGAGSTSDFIVNVFREHGIEPLAFCDNDRSKNGMAFSGVKVFALNEILNTYPSAMFYITTQLYYKEIYSQLKHNGITDERIIKHDLICQFKWEEDYLEFIRQNKEQIGSFIDCLADRKSKECMMSRLAFLVTRRRSYATDVRGKCQYFENDIIDYDSIGTFIDVGTFTGDTIMEMEKNADISKWNIIAFEMDKDLYGTAKDNLIHLGNRLTLINKAVADTDGVMEMSGSLGVMKSVIGDNFIGGTTNGEIVYETCKLDTVLNENAAWGGVFSEN